MALRQFESGDDFPWALLDEGLLRLGSKKYDPHFAQFLERPDQTLYIMGSLLDAADAEVQQLNPKDPKYMELAQSRYEMIEKRYREMYSENAM